MTTALLVACGSSAGTGSSSAASAAAGTSKASASGSGPIKIGSIMSITGPLATYGLAEEHAEQAAVKVLNASGGLLGRQVQLKVYDAAGDTSNAVSLTRRLVQQDKVDLVVGGGASSGIALAMKPILQQAGIFFMSAESDASIVAPASSSPLTFATCLSSDLIARSLLDYLKGKGITKVGLLADTSAYGMGGVTSAKLAAKADGIALTIQNYDPTSTDLTPQLNKLTDAGVKAWINWTASPSGVVFMKNASTLGLYAKGPVMSSYSYSNPTLMRQAGTASKDLVVNGVKATIYSALSKSDPQYGPLQTMATALKAYGDAPSIYASQQWDALNVTAAAVKKAGSTSGKAVAAAMNGLSYEGTQGKYSYTSTDHRGLGASVPIIMQWNGASFVQQST